MTTVSGVIHKLVHDDVLTTLGHIPDNSVDLVFADPPFNLGKKYGRNKDNHAIGDYYNWCESWIRELVRATKPGGSLFIHNIPIHLTHYATILNEIADFRHWIAWDAPTSPMGKSLQPSHYGILYYSKGKTTKFHEIRHPHKRCRSCKRLLKDYGGKKDALHPFGPLVSDNWTDLHRIKHASQRNDHPCQLPLSILERIILMATDEGDTVLDPFVGTGTTSVAAKSLGRNSIGVDNEENYLEVASDRLERVELSTYYGTYVSWSPKRDRLLTIRSDDWDKIRPYLASCPTGKELDATAVRI